MAPGRRALRRPRPPELRPRPLYLQLLRSRLLPGWGPTPQRPPPLSLVLRRPRGAGLHFLRRGPRPPVPGLGRGHRPPGAKELPCLQRRRNEKEANGECQRVLSPEKAKGSRGGARSRTRGPAGLGAGPRRLRPSFRPGLPEGASPPKPGLEDGSERKTQERKKGTVERREDREKERKTPSQPQGKRDPGDRRLPTTPARNERQPRTPRKATSPYLQLPPTATTIPTSPCSRWQNTWHQLGFSLSGKGDGREGGRERGRKLCEACVDWPSLRELQIPVCSGGSGGVAPREVARWRAAAFLGEVGCESGGWRVARGTHLFFTPRAADTFTRLPQTSKPSRMLYQDSVGVSAIFKSSGFAGL